MGCANSSNHKKKEKKNGEQSLGESSKKDGKSLILPQKSAFLFFLPS